MEQIKSNTICCLFRHIQDGKKYPCKLCSIYGKFYLQNHLKQIYFRAHNCPGCITCCQSFTEKVSAIQFCVLELTCRLSNDSKLIDPTCWHFIRFGSPSLYSRPSEIKTTWGILRESHSDFKCHIGIYLAGTISMSQLWLLFGDLAAIGRSGHF